MEVPDVFVNASVRFPNRLALAEGQREHSFAAADEAAARAATAFADAGMLPGDRVALLAKNELEYLEILVAAQRAGVIAVPLNQRLAAAELQYIIDDSAPRVVIHGPGYEDTARRLRAASFWHLGASGHGEPYDARLAAATPAPRPTLDAALPSSIVYTSGTTGRPKGAVISNGALAARFQYMALEYGIRAGDVFLQTLTMAHIAAFNCFAFAYMGATNVMMRAYTTREAIDLIQRRRVTHGLLVPTTIAFVCDELAEHPAELSSLRMMTYGASAIAPEVLRRAVATLQCGFLQSYGMTETNGCTHLRPEDHDPQAHPRRLASAGTETLSFSVRVVDEDDNDVPTGTAGEIICRGPCLMDGYWNNPSATAEALRGGWMHTGDVGYRDDDGYLYVSDRLKDMIVSGGENVYPREVEDVLHEHPAVREVAVIGIPDATWGEAVHALVVARGRPPAVEELKDLCRRRVAGYKVPKSVEFVGELPRNAIGKVLKRELREPYWAGHQRRVS